MGGPRLAVLIAAVMGAAASSPAAAQSVDDVAAARAVADSFFAAVAAERWDAAGGFLDMGRFERYFRQRVATARGQLPQLAPTVEELLAQSPEIPRMVAEWQVAQSKKAMAQRPFDDFSHEFAGVTSFRELNALALPDAAAKWLAAQDFRTQMREARKRANCPDVPFDSYELDVPERRVIGVVLADDSTAYAIHTNGPPQQDDMYGFGPRILILRPGVWVR